MATTLTGPERSLTWLVTGSSSGLGLSLVRQIQSSGHNVIATSRNPARTPDLVQEVESKGGKWIKLDVDDLNSAQVVEDLEKSGHEIDVLINNAGFSVFAAVEQIAEDEARSLMETMYFGPLRLIQAVLPHMRKRRYGVVVNISSGASLEGTESMGAYAGAKAGLDGMARVLAKEAKPFNIRVLSVCVGSLNTNISNSAVGSKNPLPEGYEGSAVDQLIRVILGGKFQVDGDKDKAAKAIYKVVVGEGVGAGREAETLLPLGRDVFPMVLLTRDSFNHIADVFGDVCNNISIDKKD